MPTVNLRGASAYLAENGQPERPAGLYASLLARGTEPPKSTTA